MVYETDDLRILIGDQADRGFWERSLAEIPRLDIVIDDGGHEDYQQVPVLEAVLPHLAPGGVYMCEDSGGPLHGTHEFVNGLSRNLHVLGRERGPMMHDATMFQRLVDGVHIYPFVTVIERRGYEMDLLHAPKHGTEWQPFLDPGEEKAPRLAAAL